MSISLIIPSYKNPKYLDLCLKSAIENKVLTETEIIVIVDGFINISQHIIDKYTDKVSFLLFNENKGLQNALNYGVWSASNQKIFIINEDNVLPQDWDKIADDICQYEKQVITFNQIEPVSGIYNFHIKDFGRTSETFMYDEFIKYEKTIRTGVLSENGGIFPFCMYKKWYMIVGGWDTFYNSPFIVDWDFFLKLEMAEVKFFRYYGMHLYHFGSKSTKNNDMKNEAETKLFYDGEHTAIEYFTYKWGFSPYREQNTNSHLPKNKLIKGILY